MFNLLQKTTSREILLKFMNKVHFFWKFYDRYRNDSDGTPQFLALYINSLENRLFSYSLREGNELKQIKCAVFFHLQTIN